MTNEIQSASDIHALLEHVDAYLSLHLLNQNSMQNTNKRQRSRKNARKKIKMNASMYEERC